jgi:hypothetical protein
MRKFIVFVLGIVMSVTCLLGLAACKDDYTFKIEYVLDTETSEVLYGDPGEKVLTNADAPITLRVSVYNERKNEYVKSPKMKWSVSNSKIAKIGKTKIVKNTQAPMQSVDIQVKSAGICTLTAKYAFAKKSFTLEISEVVREIVPETVRIVVQTIIPVTEVPQRSKKMEEQEVE